MITLILSWSGCRPEMKETEAAQVNEGELLESPFIAQSTEGPRKPTGLRLIKEGWSYECMECHLAIEARWHYDREMVEHQNIELKHGTNSFCLNCHHPENRDVYVHYDGSEIPEESVELLCRKCHGPQFRDWKQGVHGRVNGYWNADLGPRIRLNCTECHDPHDPSFKPLPPMPPPTYPGRAAGKLVKEINNPEEAGSNHG